MLRIAHLFRHPVKGIGAEALASTQVLAGACLPLDRIWALTDAAARPASGWRSARNFVRGAKSRRLMAVTVTVSNSATGGGSGNVLTFHHPDQPDLTVDPDTDPEALIDWVRPLCNPNRPAPAELLRVPGVAMTDSDFPSIAILNMASLRALSDAAGQPLDPRRFRGNIWFDGGGPWQEFEWIGRTIHVGGIPFEVRERITRCVATCANPDTGREDVDTLRLLDTGWDHQDFGVYAVAMGSGSLSIGDEVAP